MIGLRKLGLLALPVIGAAALAMPASAAGVGVGAGLVQGTVDLQNGGIPSVIPNPATTFTFSSTTLTGAYVGHSTTNASLDCAGPFTATAVANGGTSHGEDFAVGEGTVDSVTVTALTGCVVNGSLSGLYVRVGGLVVVELGGTINTVAAHCAVAALFQPPVAAIVAQDITNATFTGPFACAGATTA